MNYSESLKYVKDNDSAVFAVDKKKKELITIVYDANPDYFSDIIIRYSKELDPSMGEEDSYSPEEFEEEFKDTFGEYYFNVCQKTIEDLHGCTFETILEDINKYRLD